MQAIAYTRVSTGEQGLGLTDQRRQIEAYCTMRGLELVDLLTDNGVSGGKPLGDRQGGAKLLVALKRKRAGVVVMLKLDRGFRNAADCLATVEAWAKQGIALHIIDLGGSSICTDTAAGKFMLTVLAGAAEMERNLIRERTRAALSVKRDAGERVSRHAPFGYDFDAGHLVENDGEQQAIRAAMELRQHGLSLRAISGELASRGHLSRNGRPFTAKVLASVLNREAAA